MKKQYNEEIPRKTLELNFEVKLFNDRLKSHLDIRSVDLQLLDQLQKTTELISNLMSNCTLIDIETINVNQNSSLLQMHRQLYCHPCNTAIKTDVYRVQEHLASKQHHQLTAKAAKKEQKKKKSVGNATHVFTNSNLTNAKVESPKPILLSESAFKITPVVPAPKDKEQTVEEKNGEPQSSGFKLSKKVQNFLRDRNLEKLGRRLAEEGEAIKMSSKHHTVIESIQKALKPNYPNVKVFPFGSRISGIGTANSDLDLFIDLNNQYFKHAGNIDTREFRCIEESLKSSKQWIEFVSITGARTPILQAFFVPEKLPCDLSFSNGLSHCNSKLISYFIDLQPLFAKIGTVVKEWAHEADMKMNSYALTLLLVFYFQQNKLLPTVHQLQKDTASKLIGHWHGHLGTITWTEKSNSFRNHLIGFFDYYGNTFNFQNMIVCPYLGIPIEKTRFHYGKEKLPEELNLYMSYMNQIDLRNADVLTDLFAYEKPMVVQDPFELIHNVAKGVRPTSCERFVNYCKLTADYLKGKRVI